MLCRAEGLSVETDWDLLNRRRQDDLLVVVFGGAPGTSLYLQSIVARGGSVLIAADDGATMNRVARQMGIQFYPGPVNVVDQSLIYQGYSDCFRVSSIDTSHPVTKGVGEIVANRPGVLHNRRRGYVSTDMWRPLALMPRAVAPNYVTGSATREFEFMAALRSRSGARALAISDHSVFTNQMLAVGDNARLAAQALAWLARDRHDKVVILVDRDIVSPTDPTLVDLEIPPPTPQQVRDALANLPPEQFREVVNTVASVVEDEGILDDVFSRFFRSLPPHLYNRILILGASLMLAFFAIMRAVSFRGTLEVEANGDEIAGARSQRVINRHERHGVAQQMMDRFRVDVTGSARTSWDHFVMSIRIVGNPMETGHLRLLLNNYRERKPAFWTAPRLEELKSHLDQWRHLLQNGVLEYDPEEHFSTNNSD